MSFLDFRKPWCTQLLCQKSLRKLNQVLRGLDKYGFPTADEIENCAYQNADRELVYVNMVAKQIYYILELKKLIETGQIDQEALMESFDRLRYGDSGVRNMATQDGLYYDRSNYGNGNEAHRQRHVNFELDKGRQNQVPAVIPSPPEETTEVTPNGDVAHEDESDDASSASSSQDYDIAQLNLAIEQIKSSDFNTGALMEKLKTKYSTSDAKLSHKMKMKIHCLMELLEDFECYDKVLETCNEHV